MQEIELYFKVIWAESSIFFRRYRALFPAISVEQPRCIEGGASHKYCLGTKRCGYCVAYFESRVLLWHQKCERVGYTVSPAFNSFEMEWVEGTRDTPPLKTARSTNRETGCSRPAQNLPPST